MAEALLEQAAPLEVRVSGRTLRAEFGYGRRARDRGERFAPGAFEPIYPVTLNVQHDPMLEVASTADRSLRLRDTAEAMILEADLRGTPRDGPLGLVTRGALRAISPEFYAYRERREGSLRVIERAGLPAFGLVDVGSYATPLELRTLADAWLTSTIPTGHVCSCECAGRDCHAVKFEAGSLDGLLGGAQDVIAHAGSLAEPLGSLARGTLLAEATDDGVRVGLTDAGTAAAAKVRDAGRVAPVHVRPLIDVDASESTVADGVRTYAAAAVLGLLVKTAPPDRRDGWDPAEIDGAATGPARRARLWL